MKYGVIFLLLSLCVAAYALTLGNAIGQGLGLWTSFSFLMVAVAYVTRNPGLLGKSRMGSSLGLASSSWRPISG